ncbi:MAG: tetratricopeptide repeat protein [Saprospiraceae bacterium]|nr:tetratricopeptide repeat protein [Saprospiraceae bacterium]
MPNQYKIWIYLLLLVSSQPVRLISQTEPEYFEKRVQDFDKKYGKGNTSTKRVDLTSALLLRDTLVHNKKYDLQASLSKTIGKMHQQLGLMDGAERFFLDAIKAGRLGKDSLWIASTYARLGSFYATENRNFLSLEYQMRALLLYEKYDKKRSEIPEVYNDIARAYIQLGELETASNFLEKSMALKKSLNDTMRIGIITTLYADIYRLQKNYPKAETFYLKDIPKRKAKKNFEGLVISYLGLGDTYLEWKKYNKAEATYLLALQAADTIKRYRTIGLSLVKLGNLYKETRQFEKAEKFYNRAIRECTQVDSRVYQLSAYEALYDMYKESGRIESALQYLEKYKEVNDINTKESLQLKAEDMKASYDLKERENDVLRLDEENRRNNQIRQILLAGIVMLLLLSGFLIVLFYSRNKALKQLSDEQAQTHKLLSEKENLLNHLNETHHQLVHSEKMASIGVMTAGIAHELNNPVSSMHASAEALKMDYEDLRPLFEVLMQINRNADSDLKDLHQLRQYLNQLDLNHFNTELQTLLQIIMNGSQRTSEIIQGLKTFVRDTGSEKMEYRIEDGIDAALTLLHHKTKDRIIIEKNYLFGGTVKCQVSKINQVFLNLLDNAIQAISNTGKIKIETTLQGAHCHISITDTGMGMDKEIQTKVFEPFFTTKEIGKGTGLGLAISYAIIKEHEGEISVNSKPNEGTTFVIKLPL